MFRIGALEIRSRVLQAPMCGCSEKPFRALARSWGCAFAFPPMLHAGSVVRSTEARREFSPVSGWDRPLGVQLMGTDPAVMRDAALIAEAAGAALVDVNAGCPARKVVAQGAGAGLLKDPARVGAIVRAIAGAVRIPVTVKMRQGYQGSGPQGFLDVARAAEAHGAAAVTIHGRMQEQKHGGEAHLEAIRLAKEALRIPVIGNGSLWTGADARRMAEATGCDAVMVARGSLGRPWIYREMERAIAGAAAPEAETLSRRVEALAVHARGMFEWFEETEAALKLRKISCWYLRDFPLATRVRAVFQTFTLRRQYEDLLEAVRSHVLEGVSLEPALSCLS